jgi:hypothetical protein
MGEGRKVHRVLMGKPEERDHWEDRDVGGRMKKEFILGWLAKGCRVNTFGSG